MARKPRIEYEGAVYHVMNRGDRGGKVFKDNLDYELFLHTTAEVCERTGWRIHAYALLPNHFHWLLETPEGNLVSGMKWFMGAYSQRFNARHGQRGHVFQGRYKAVVIDGDSGDHFETVSTYVHLNPARAGLLTDSQEGLHQYRWSSYPEYLQARSKRPGWLEVKRVLGNMSLSDRATGRREYERYMQGRVAELRSRGGKKSFKEQWKPIQYGWYVGDEQFKAKLLKRVAGAVAGKDRSSYSGEAIHGHDEQESEAMIIQGMKVLDMTEDQLEGLRKGEERKCVLAWLVHTRTMASHKWIGERLRMGCPSQISVHVAKVRSNQHTRLNHLRQRVEKAIIEKKD